MNRKAKVAIACAALLGAFALGRFLVPTKVVEKTVVDETVVAKYEEKLNELKQENLTLRENQHMEKVVVKYADGTTVEHTKVDTVKSVDKESVVVTEREKQGSEVVDLHVEKQKVVENTKPDWSLSANVGFDLHGFTQTYGAEVGRRVLGPVWLTVGANTQMQGYVGVRMEF